jgi:hypothetical protein
MSICIVEHKSTKQFVTESRILAWCAKLEAIEKQALAAPDQQISLTDPDSCSMATSGRGSGVVGYNMQTAVDTENPSDRRARGEQCGFGSLAARQHGQRCEGGDRHRDARAYADWVKRNPSLRR